MVKDREVVFEGRDKKMYAIQLDQITYYRSFVESSDKMGETSSLKTNIYLVGSAKAITIPIPFEEFRRLRSEALK